MEDRTLIELPPQASTSSGFRAWVIVLLLGINAAILLGTAGIDLIFPAHRREALGLEKAREDERRANAKWSDGSMTSLIEHDYRQTSRVRRELSKPYTEWLFRVFGEGGASVLVGKDGMLFLRDRIEVPETHFRVGAQRTGAIYAAVSRRLEALGIRMVVAPVPRKAVICADWLPHGWRANRPYDEIILEEFERRGVFTVDLLTALEPHADEAFLRMDTHWSTQGMRESARALGEMTGWIKPADQRYGSLREVPAPKTAPLGDLTLVMGVEFQESDAPKYQRPMVEVILEDGQRLPKGDIHANIVLCGTSFSQHGTFASFWAHFLGLSVQTYSIPGAPPYAALAAMFAERMPDRLPHIVIEEVPNHHIISAGHDATRWAVNAYAAEVFTKYRPEQHATVPLPPEAFRTNAPMGTPVHAVRGRVLLDLDAGWLAHSSGGAAELYLEGEVLGGEVRMDVACDGGTLSAPWPKESRSLQLPLLQQSAGAHSVQVVLATLTPEADFRLDKAEIRVVGRPSAAVSGDVLEPTQESEGWRQTVRFGPNVTIPAHGTLVLETASGDTSADAVRVVLPSTTSEPDFVFALEGVRAGGAFVFDLGPLFGHSLTELHVVSQGNFGSETPTRVTRARLIPMR